METKFKFINLPKKLKKMSWPGPYCKIISSNNLSPFSYSIKDFSIKKL